MAGWCSALSMTTLARELHDILEIPLTSCYTKNGNHYMRPDKGKRILKVIIAVLVDALKRGESFNIPGFGTFIVKERVYHATRPIIANINGQIFLDSGKRTPPPRKYVHFKPSHHLMALVNLEYPNVPSYEHNRAMKTWRRNEN